MAWQSEGDTWNGGNGDAWGAQASDDYGGGGDGSFDKPSRSSGCFKCGEEGHISRECPNQSSNSRACHRCNEEGHIARDCPHQSSDSRTCRKCNEEGHMARDCPNAAPMTCRKCNEEGHMARDCPNAAPMTCRRCNEEGHMARECPKEDDRACFQCGQTGHRKQDCPDRPKMVCHRCKEEGHMIKDCPEPPTTELDEDGKPIGPVTYVPVVEEITDESYNQMAYSDANLQKYDTMEVTVSDQEFAHPLQSFSDAQLCATLAEKLSKLKYNRPTPVQSYCIPIISAGKDLIACSQTGSGKSAAFILPILQNLFTDPEVPERSALKGKKPQCPLVVVLSPTRELCIQLYDHFRLFSQEYPRRLGIATAYGGTMVRHNVEGLQDGTHVLCAVPGRLKHFVDNGTVSFEKVRYLILDEADRMLDDGFSEAIREFATHSTMPAKEARQTLMFSATFQSDIEQLARQMMRPQETVKLVVGILGGVNSDVTQTFEETTDYKTKKDALVRILNSIPGCKTADAVANGRDEGRARVIVFMEQKKQADILGIYLSQKGFSATTIHGDRIQQQREEAIRTFRDGNHAVLVATEVAARGLDIKGVGLVVNFDMPKEIDRYIHRVGRTGRIGQTGQAISFFDPSKDADLCPGLVKVLNECQQPVPDFISKAAAGGYDDFGAGGDGNWNGGGGGAQEEEVSGW